ncbi:Wzz/FepE/Etk N-terminal domain-containing protein [Roseateles sp. YR242]|uniref:GumC family protein n=1 Tax=Roseateles sp. YR242 TaxID=1855305 RepID=UPI001C42FAB9|nr:Wzz/FepE/Etk N-terminal domain-containing protein [Roseateles sp. YR242]
MQATGTPPTEGSNGATAAPQTVTLRDVYTAVRPRWKTLLLASVAAGAFAYGISLLIPPTFTAKTSIISPQQQQNSAAAALSSLGALSGLAGAAGVIKSPSDQYIGLMQSVTVSDRLVDEFKLMDLYDAKFKEDARKTLEKRVRISAGKKDNLISVEVDDRDPVRAAAMANAYVRELKQLTNGLALTEAQQRRNFFEQQLTETKEALKVAQRALEKSGFSAGALKSEPKSAAEAYARVKAEIASTEVRLGSLRRTLTETAPEIQQQTAVLSGLRSQLAGLEQPLQAGGNQDYVSAYREYKYQETLFEVYARQFELAKMDEAREGTLIQVLDPATPPEKRSKPRRSTIAAGAAFVTFLLLCLFFTRRHFRTTTA